MKYFFFFRKFVLWSGLNNKEITNNDLVNIA